MSHRLRTRTLANADSFAVQREALRLLADYEARDPSATLLRKHLRFCGIISSLKQNFYGNSAWGRRMNGRGLVQRRWKWYNKDKYEKTWPFRERSSDSRIWRSS